jgi:16S rRNA (uracil1498-N3)-methyltransferase
VRIPRVFVPGSVKPGGSVELLPEESHHLVRVLRRSPGDRVLLASGAAGTFAGEIDAVREEASGPVVVVRVLEEAVAAAPPVLPWVVAAAMVKGEGFEQAIRMACELGLERFVPLATQRTAVHPRADSNRVRRWSRLAREAAKQCGRPVPMDVGSPTAFEVFLSTWREGPSRRAPGASETSEARGWILEPSAPFRAALGGPEGRGASSRAVFLVGPEGGFTPTEVTLATEAGFERLGLPTPVLRTPTAVAIVGALGIVSHLAGSQ